jgi:SAM-dependent methyltransferase
MTNAAVFDAWHANVADSPAWATIFQRALGLPPQVVSNSLLTGAGLDEVVAALRLAPGQTLVDLACGRGGYGREVARRTGARLVGLDFSAVAVAIAARGGPSSQARFCVADFTAPGLRDHSAHAVMCIDAIQFGDPPLAALRPASSVPVRRSRARRLGRRRTTGHLLGGPGDACHAGQDGALEDLADVVQRADKFLEPVQGAVVPPVQQGAAVLLGGDGPAGQLDRIVSSAEEGLDGGVEDQGQGGELGGGEGTLATFGLMDGLPAPGLAQILAEGFAQLGQRQLPLRPQACDLPADGFFNPHPGSHRVNPGNDNE